MIENPRAIGAWALATFGSQATLYTMACRVLVEAAELTLEVAKQSDAEKVAEEAADVYVTLCHMTAIIQANGYMGERELCPYNVVFDTRHFRFGETLDVVRAVDNARELAKHPGINILSVLTAMNTAMCAIFENSIRWAYNLGDAVDKKMATNRARVWNVVNGVGQHVKESN